MKELEKLKLELKQMKIKADKCQNIDYKIGYISAVSTIEGLIAIYEYELTNATSDFKTL